jgi:hypothetical protein
MLPQEGGRGRSPTYSSREAGIVPVALRFVDEFFALGDGLEARVAARIDRNTLRALPDIPAVIVARMASQKNLEGVGVLRYR